jgi:hypothetical protein
MTKKNLNNRWKRLRKKRDAADITKQNTPGDHQILANDKGGGSGIIRVETGDLHRLSSLDDAGEDQQTGPSRVVLVIVMLALIFIAIITYFVMQMPQKD